MPPSLFLVKSIGTLQGEVLGLVKTRASTHPTRFSFLLALLDHPIFVLEIGALPAMMSSKNFTAMPNGNPEKFLKTSMNSNTTELPLETHPNELVPLS